MVARSATHPIRIGAYRRAARRVGHCKTKASHSLECVTRLRNSTRHAVDCHRRGQARLCGQLLHATIQVGYQQLWLLLQPAVSLSCICLSPSSIYVLREAAAQFRKPVLLYSMGKDSTVLLHLAQKAFWRSKVPFPLLHVHTTWEFRETCAFRDKIAERGDVQVLVP